MTRERIELGRKGEDLAVQRLIEEGRRILQRNYRNPFGEIDIIAQDGAVLCFIEVRTRTQDWHGDPLESISPSKQRKMIRAAQGYLAHAGCTDIDARFDVVAVTPQESGGYSIEILKNAFDAG